mmetsp:Transcript_7427/g.17593  ORF Transcript_7427/g.17593 Transcript_7427/m.17593 type:complete len:172 (-) Transcript_7427:79-594(-)
MIRGAKDTQFELEVVEREHRFIGGLQWHFQDILQQLEAEERLLLTDLARRSSSGAEPLGGRSPKTPPLQALIALDPLCLQPLPPLQLDDGCSSEDGKRAPPSPGSDVGARAMKALKREVGSGGRVPREDSSTESSDDGPVRAILPLTSSFTGKAARFCESSSGGESCRGSL